MRARCLRANRFRQSRVYMRMMRGHIIVYAVIRRVHANSGRERNYCARRAYFQLNISA